MQLTDLLKPSQIKNVNVTITKDEKGKLIGLPLTAKLIKQQKG